MAQAGIPPSSQAPQSDSGSSNANPNQPQSAPLIAGKYKSVDDAIVASEQGFHKVSEQLAGLTRVLEGALAAPTATQVVPQYGYSGVPIGYQPQGGYGTPMDPYGRAPQVDQIDPAAFITNPGRFLQERDEKLANRIIGQVADTVRDTVSNALAVADFKISHPEMKKHEMIVQSFLGQTDARKSMRQRLEDAAQATSNYLKANGLSGNANGNGSGNDSQAPNGGSYVEPPSGAPTTPFQGQAATAGVPLSDEAELADYIRDRNADFAAKFGIADPSKIK